MPRTARKQSASGKYHVMLRGINKQQIFEDDSDYKRFCYIMGDCKEEYDFRLHAYCIMGNHVHILIEVGDVSLSEILRKIEVRFAQWYNKKYQRTGHLFQDRFRSEVIEDDAHFLRVMRYIHHNPIKAGLCDSLEEYPWSSYRAYKEKDDSLTDIQEGIAVMGNYEDLLDFLNEVTEDEFMDISNHCRLTDNEAKQIIYETSNCSDITSFQSLDKMERLSYIKKLKKAGLSIRQISRLCGISKGIVERNIK